LVDPFTLFMANAIVMAMIALAFLAAWMHQREARHWPSWMFANFLLSGSMISCMMIGPGIGLAGAPVAMVLIVGGFGLRWRAARQFSGRSAPWLLPVVLPTATIGILVLLPSLVPYPVVYGAHNAIAAVQGAATLYEFWRDRQDRLTSRYGLIASYGFMSVAFALRALQGVTVGYEMDHLLPRDLMLQLHLTIGLIHITSAGAFALSLAYERGAAELRNAAAELRQTANSDALTGVPNRRAFEEHFGELGRAKTPNCALALLDIDHFKTVNDRFGHAAGDKVLRICARTIGETIGQAGLVARIGGEEFGVLLIDKTADEAAALIEQAREAIAQTGIGHGDGSITLTVSAGLVHTRNGFGSFDHAMSRADASLYAAKHAGRNRVERAA